MSAARTPALAGLPARETWFALREAESDWRAWVDRVDEVGALLVSDAREWNETLDQGREVGHASPAFAVGEAAARLLVALAHGGVDVQRWLVRAVTGDDAEVAAIAARGIGVGVGATDDGGARAALRRALGRQDVARYHAARSLARLGDGGADVREVLREGAELVGVASVPDLCREALGWARTPPAPTRR